MMSTVTATYAKNNLGELMDNVIASKNKILIKRAGRPAVYITPILDKFEINYTNEEFDEIEKGMKEFRKSFKFSF
ncbi:hypothetical protein CO009_03960 [Candidatus Shapirobacteria bacterium CG_4_8_14_3_um_filter_35_11]|uniref:Antitoxin n=5 Tax=Candidatus Shapironibacteriota TaxID=1752721 RepID=A0A1J5I3C6_9BACT|nr:MAG: hypothetical protein AUK05_02600 [Candidatus Shapirobacteria bacterium CG2_30_35_20]PIV07609.1 MAG: hypothetical protein COS53_01525 [Candidatus Shapirobacteria bacterium CG03_land_8_20_14_0_80_35_14]PIX67797.1 MAG: hypothetical protein COZ41_03090 [Candidatus Shapirobacteria bacterium CG_4_10_14_3_um_filter_35_13]PJC79676.1 MAG: hypothetical protein CO009_03960 [Candidatus Shapirobacteria bacterium CG_4_8_14_3_um_filter_35_11]PJE66745.1 MAG: hypothetical protein COU93_02590 [Candidatus